MCNISFNFHVPTKKLMFKTSIKLERKLIKQDYLGWGQKTNVPKFENTKKCSEIHMFELEIHRNLQF